VEAGSFDVLVQLEAHFWRRMSVAISPGAGICAFPSRESAADRAPEENRIVRPPSVFDGRIRQR